MFITVDIIFFTGSEKGGVENIMDLKRKGVGADKSLVLRLL